MLKRKRQKPQHIHYVITCGNPPCGGQWESCGLPCFIYCPFCGVRNILWGDGRA